MPVYTPFNNHIFNNREEHMKKYFLCLLVYALFTFITACELVTPVHVTGLSGAWTDNEFIQNEEGDWEKVTFVCSGDSASGYTATYIIDISSGTKDNLSPFIVAELTYYYTIPGDEVSIPENSQKINFTQISFTMKYTRQDMVDAANSMAVYGYTDWQLNVPKDIAGKEAWPGDGFNSTNGTHVYNVFKLMSDDRLYLGDNEADENYDGSSDENRPRVLGAALDKIDIEFKGVWTETTFHFAGNGDDGVAGTSDDEWERYKAVISGGTIIYTGQWACGATMPSLPEVEYSLTLTYKKGGPVIVPFGARKIDYTQISFTTTLFTPDMVTFSNDNSMYGYTDWQLNVAKDISGREAFPGDGFTDENGTDSYSIYQIKCDGRLYFGDGEFDPNYDETADAKRPRVLLKNGLTKIY
jgi:hypothetical protein